MEKQVKVIYRLSQEGQKKSLMSGGDGKNTQVIFADVTPELLERANISTEGELSWNVERKPSKLRIDGVHSNFDSYTLDVPEGFYERHKPRIVNDFGHMIISFDEPQTPDSLLTYVKDMEAATAENATQLNALLPEKISAWEKAVAEHKARAAKAATDQKAREDRQKTERERKETEKTTWITAHGSDHLRHAAKLGYDCQRQYITERVAHELPGFTVDFDELAKWKSRTCPSEEALELVEALIKADHDTKCVWLTNSTVKPEWDDDEDDYREGFEPCEAVVIQGYIGKYDLVKII